MNVEYRGRQMRMIPSPVDVGFAISVRGVVTAEDSVVSSPTTPSNVADASKIRPSRKVVIRVIVF